MIRKISIFGVLVFQLVCATSLAQDKTESLSSLDRETSVPMENASTMSVKNKTLVTVPFSVTAYFLGGYSDQQFYNENPSFGIFDSYISFNYHVNRDVRISARPAFGYSTSGNGRNGDPQMDKATIRDFSFAGTIRNIGEDYLPDDVTLKFKPRLFLPTSDASKDQGLIAKLRFEWEIKYYVGRYNNFRIYLVPNYYFQRNTVYLSPAQGTKPTLLYATTMADSEHGVEYSYDINKYFALKPSVGFEESWSNTSIVNSDREKVQYRKSSWYYGGGLEINPSRDWGFTLGVRTSKDMINTDKSEETSYTILADAVIF
ncbi:MAG: hypothetical protein H7235_12035 [Bdellovibrionaceae bacterium]|nr:hypothetical protein [Pseudobdellovibrionaceae bacterium]